MRERGRWSDSGWVGADEEDDLDRRLAEEEEPFDPARPHVMTVLGPIEPGALGVTLVNERIAGAPPGAAREPDLRPDHAHAFQAELEDFYAAGGRAVVDGTTADRGRDAAALRWVAARAAVHVVAVTGRVGSRGGGLGEADRSAEGTDDLAAEFGREVIDGIGGTGVRVGAIVVELGGEEGAPADAGALRAAGRAHRATGAPVVVRAERAPVALGGLERLAGEGVAAKRVTVGGLAGRIEESELRALLVEGVFVAFDRLGRGGEWPRAEQAATIGSLVEHGFGDRLVLSAGFERRSSLRAYGGGPGWVWLLERFPLLLMDAGVEAPVVRRLLVDNPARALTTARMGR